MRKRRRACASRRRIGRYLLPTRWGGLLMLCDFPPAHSETMPVRVALIREELGLLGNKEGWHRHTQCLGRSEQFQE